MDLTGTSGMSQEESVSEQLHSSYMSLLGGAAWMTLTVAAISVFIQALQRHAQGPRLIDCKRLNALVRYLKRGRIGIWYTKIKGPWRLVAVSDAAFRAQPEDSSGLALRGCVILLVGENDKSPASQDASCHMLEYVCRRQRRVIRSTYSGELNALVDTIELLLVVQMTFYQIFGNPGVTATEMAKKMENGELEPPVEAVTDARSVFDSIAAQDVGELQEGSLKLHLLSVRDRLASGTLRRLWWSDTRDMLADGLTKGAASRAQLVECGEKGLFRVVHQPAMTSCHSGRKYTTGNSICNKNKQD